MNLFALLVALVMAGWPIPNFRDSASILEWWTNLGPAASDLIAAIVNQIKTTGQALIDLPGGAVISLTQDEDGKWVMSPYHQELLCAAAPVGMEQLPEKDGKWKEIIKTILPYLLQILPLFLADAKQKDDSAPAVV